MTDELNRSEVITRRFELDEQISLIQARHKAELAPLQDELTLCERFVADSMNKANEQSVKIDGVGMTFFTTQDSVTVDNMDGVIDTILQAAPPPDMLFDADAAPEVKQQAWESVLNHIHTHGLWALLNKAVNKTVAKEMIAANTPPAGVKYDARKVLAWRRGKV